MQIRAPYRLTREEPTTVRQERTRSKQMVQELLMAAVQKCKDTAVKEVSGPTKLETTYDTVLFAALAIFAGALGHAGVLEKISLHCKWIRTFQSKGPAFLLKLKIPYDATISLLMTNYADHSDFTAEFLISELAKLRPDLVVVPRQATHIMALRGTQATGVFEHEKNRDVVGDYLNLDGVGKIPGFADLEDSIDVDERAWLVAAAVWRGCIEGYEEWQRLQAKEGDTPFIQSWLKPCVLRSPAPGEGSGEAKA